MCSICIADNALLDVSIKEHREKNVTNRCVSVVSDESYGFRRSRVPCYSGLKGPGSANGRSLHVRATPFMEDG